MRSATLSFFVAAKWSGNLNLVSATYIVLAFGGAFVSVQSRVTPSYEEDVMGTGMPALGQVMTLYDRSKASRPPTPSHAALSVPLIAWLCPIWSRLALLSQPTLRGSRLFPSYAALSVPLIAWSCPIWSRLALLSQPTLCGLSAP